MSLNEAPIVTYVMCAITLVAAVGGIIVVLVGPAGALSFEDYLNLMTKFVFGLGILGVGRGISAGLKAHNTNTVIVPEEVAKRKTAKLSKPRQV